MHLILSFLHLPGRNEGTNGRRRSLTFPPLAALPLNRVLQEKFLHGLMLFLVLLHFCSYPPHFPLLLLNGKRNQGSVTSQCNVGQPSWICYHRDVHAADSAQLGGGCIKELSLLFPTFAAGVFALGWWSPTVALCHLFAAQS